MESKGLGTQKFPYSNSSSSKSPRRRGRGDPAGAAAAAAANDDDDDVEGLFGEAEDRRMAEVEQMRAELLQFVDRSRHATDSEGAPLLHFPENFDSVAAAMSRADLTSSEEKPWSRYLLESATEKEEEHDDADRNIDDILYSGGGSVASAKSGKSGGKSQSKKTPKGSPVSLRSAASRRRAEAAAEEKEELRLQRGLAEIALLDRQLKMASRRESESREAAALLLEDMPLLQGEFDGSAPPSGRMSAASSKYGGGSTFLTRIKGDIARSGNTSPLGTGRSVGSINTEAFSERSVQDNVETPRDAGGELDDDYSAGRSVGETGDRDDDGSDRLGPLRSGRRNFLDENKKALGDGSHLTPEQKRRVNALLGMGGVDELDEYAAMDPYSAADARFLDELEKISTFGYDAAAKAHLDEIDSKLAALRPNIDTADFAVVASSSSAAGPEQDEAPGGKSNPNYLLEQRVERTRDLYSKQLDSALKSFKRPMGKDDLLGLVECPTVGSTSTFSPSGGAPSRPRHVHSAITSSGVALNSADQAAEEHNSRSEGDSGRTSELRRHSSIRELPELSSVDPYRSISMDDVLSVIEELCGPSQVDSYPSFGVPPGEEDTVKSHNTHDIAATEEIDRLLEKHRLEIMQLAMLRNKQLDFNRHSASNLEGSSGISGGSTFVDSLAGFAEAAPPLSDIELAQLAAQQAVSAAASTMGQSATSVIKGKKGSNRARRVVSKEAEDAAQLIGKPNPSDAALKPTIRLRAPAFEQQREEEARETSRSTSQKSIINSSGGDDLISAHRAMYPVTRRQISSREKQNPQRAQQRTGSSGLDSLPAMPSKFTRDNSANDEAPSRPDKEIDDLAKRILNLENLTGSVIDSFFDADDATPIVENSALSPEDIQRGSEFKSISSGIEGMMDKMNHMLDRAVYLGREDDAEALETAAFVDSSAYDQEPAEDVNTLRDDYEKLYGDMIYNTSGSSAVVI